MESSGKGARGCLSTAFSSSSRVPRAASALDMEAGCDLWVNGVNMAVRVAGRRQTDDGPAAFTSSSACGPVAIAPPGWLLRGCERGYLRRLGAGRLTLGRLLPPGGAEDY